LDDCREGAEPSYRFGPYRLSTRRRLLGLGETPIPLAPKLFDLLVLLVSEAGHIVPRQRISEAIWPGVFVSETNLRQKVWLLRRALKEGGGDLADYIETVPRRGYRFVAPVILEAGSSPALPAALVARALPPPPRRRFRPWLRNGVGLVNVVLMTLALSADRSSVPRVHGPATLSASPGDTRRSLALLRLRSHSRDPQDGWIADAFTEMLRAELAASPGFRLVPAETVQGLVRELSPPPAMTLSAQSLARVRHLVGGEWVVAGALVTAGSGEDARLRVDLLVQCTQSREIIGTVTQSGLRRELTDLASRAGHDLRASLGAAHSRLAPTATRR
jgi:DNA-binding winged helix-turn-helix (wHTH) protein